jgi:para-nitrobenzyl esterase
MKRFTGFLLIALVLLSTIAVSCAPAAVPLADPIKIDTGLVSGAVVGAKQDIHVYKGIPFAAPPVGDLRWKPPQPAAPWQGVKECTEFGPAPMGYNSASFPVYAKTASEDCLYLNVWTPAKTTSDKLPVMVWIYGGAFWFGEGSNPLYDGVNLANHGVILVTFNYRVGPLGFLAHPLLSKESPHNSSSNYGLLDQIAALQWVQKNIAAFGGDPNRVTIFGQSAGATSVICLMASPLTTGLFQRAISESMYESAAWTDIRENKYGQEPKEKMGEQLAKDLGCDNAPDPIACMRAKSAQEVMDTGKPAVDLFGPSVYRYEPCVDGWVIPDLPFNIFQAGKQQKVTLLIGSNADEGRLFTSVANATVDSYTQYVNTMAGDKAQQVLTMFPASDDAQAKASENQIVTLITFTCPARAYAGAMSKVNSKAYFYQFTRVPPGSKMGAFHLLEIGYVFGNFRPFMSPLKAEAYYNETDRALSDAMMSCWTGFAAAGDPNQEGLTNWPVYDAKTGQYLNFGDKIEVKSGINTEACDLLMGILKAKRGQ